MAGPYSLLRVHLPPHTNIILESLLEMMLPSYLGLDARLPQLLHWLPVRYSTLKHTIGLTKYRASRYFARLPTNSAEAGYG